MGIDLFEHGARHVDFATDRKVERFIQLQGQGTDGFHVLRDILARDAVSARRAQYEHTVFIGDGCAQTVDLRLDGIDRMLDISLDAGQKVSQFLDREDVRQ